VTSEFRQDRTTGEWVIVAPQRSLRPAHSLAQAAAPPVPYDPSCPFCPGNEAQLPGIIAETPAPAPPGWRVRVVPNKFPAVDATAATAENRGRHVVLAGFGYHEVVIESPRHDADLATMPKEERAAVLSAYRDRLALQQQRDGIEGAILYRNHGSASGASIAHPHAQLIALGMVPPWLKSRLEWARQYYRERSCCAVCDAIELERSDGRRIVEETRQFVALVPFAATVPFETWIIPKRHEASFADMDDGERAEFGDVLQRALLRLKAIHGNPPYNFVVDTAPRSALHVPDFHWRLRIAPNLVTWGGFELGTRMPINPSSPERDAEMLRAYLPQDAVR
jgi:UDPglucose--hexose-1-phosphate uridylyltransferase